MIDQLDQQLAAWVASVIGDATVRFDMPTERPKGRGVVIYLFSFSPTPAASTSKITPIQFTLRYLVSTWAESPPEAHKLLGNLILAALEESAYEVELESVPVETWQAFQLPPQPSFVLCVLLRKPRSELAAKYATKLVIEPRPSVTFYGLVKGPEEIPIPHARIELRNYSRSTYSDAVGRFRFNNLPADIPLNLRVKAKRRYFDVTVERLTSVEDPLVIPFTFEWQEQ